jgi:hypothetical protein
MGLLEMELKELKEKFVHDRIGRCENCPILTSDNDELRQQVAMLRTKNDLLESFATKEPIHSSCANCAILETELKDAKTVIDSIKSIDSCSSCISLKVDLESAKKENSYLQQSLERFAQGKKKLNMILDQSKVSINNQGIGYDFAESLRIGTHEILGVTDGMIELAQKPITFKSAGFIGNTSSSTPKTSEPKMVPMTSKSKPVELPRPKNPKQVEHKQNQRQTKPVEKTKYECTYCGKAGHLVGFCFRKARKERQERLRTRRATRVPERFECACHCRSSGVSRFPRRDVHPRRDLAGLGQNRHGHLAYNSAHNTKDACTSRMIQYWIPKSFFTNPSTESSRSAVSFL